MNKMLFAFVVTVMMVSGCSDKDDATTGKTETSMLDKAKESTSNAMDDMKHATGQAMDNAGEMASDTATAAGEMASNAMDGASKMATEAKTAVVASAGSAMDSAKEMMSDSKEAVADMSDEDDAAEMADGGAAGLKVYQGSCQSCHAIGVAGAPKLGDKAAWAPRIAMGIDALVASSIKGKNIMPPRGACATCSDDDIKAAVLYMVSQSK